jgi:hypothetical protein
MDLDSHMIQDVSVTVRLNPILNFQGPNINVPVVSEQCVDFTGGLTLMNKDLSSAVIPGGFVCTFFM